MKDFGWPFENFKPWEFDCGCGCGFNIVDLGLVTTLQRLRDATGRRIDVTSGCRCAAHNLAVGGVPERAGRPGSGSQHLYGRAADIVVEGLSSFEVEALLKSLYIAYKIYAGYVYRISATAVHVDGRTPESPTVRRWRV